MRTTLDIEDDVLEHARSVAEASGISLGRVISDWSRKGSEVLTPYIMVDDFPVFVLPDDAKPIRLEDIERALYEDDLEYAVFPAKKAS